VLEYPAVYPEASRVGEVGFQEQTNTSAVCPLSVTASLAGITLTSGLSTTSAAIIWEDQAELTPKIESCQQARINIVCERRSSQHSMQNN
jgi:hypothetical protein